MAFIFPFFIVCLAMFIIGIAFNGRVSPERLATDERVGESARPLVMRFIERSQRYRRNGALGGLIAATIIWIALTLNNNSASASISSLAVMSIALSGSVLGALLAEAFRFSRARGPRSASLDVRSPDAYDDKTSGRRETWLWAFSAVAVAASVFLAGPVGVQAVLVFAVVVLSTVRRWGTRRITLRPRAAVSETLVEADDLIRRLAVASGISRPIVTLIALAISAQFGAATPDVVSGAESYVGFASALMSGGLFLAAVWWWWENLTFGLVPADGARSRPGLTLPRMAFVASMPVLAFVVLFLLRAA